MSTDGTLDVIKKYEHKVSKWISEPDSGIYDAMNKGIEMATGDLVGLINADDWMTENSLSVIADHYIKNKNTILCGNVFLWNNSEKGKIKKSDLKHLKREMTIWHPGVFVPLEIYKRIGAFNVQYKILGDYEFILRAYLNGETFLMLAHTTANMSFGGVSNKLIKKSMQESFDIKQKLLGKALSNHFYYFYYLLKYLTIIKIKKIIY